MALFAVFTFAPPEAKVMFSVTKISVVVESSIAALS